MSERLMRYNIMIDVRDRECKDVDLNILGLVRANGGPL
jgi:hypothetical protein